MGVTFECVLSLFRENVLALDKIREKLQRSTVCKHQSPAFKNYEPIRGGENNLAPLTPLEAEGGCLFSEEGIMIFIIDRATPK